MSTFASNYSQDKINDAIYKGVNPSLGTSRYLALFSTNPTAAGTGTEASGGSYARQSISFNASSAAVSTNSNAITFNSLGAGSYAYYGVYDALTAGNLIVFGALPSPINANSGDAVTIAAGGISFSLSGS
jgi:hypothetical protein